MIFPRYMAVIQKEQPCRNIKRQETWHCLTKRSGNSDYPRREIRWAVVPPLSGPVEWGPGSRCENDMAVPQEAGEKRCGRSAVPAKIQDTLPCGTRVWLHGRCHEQTVCSHDWIGKGGNRNRDDQSGVQHVPLWADSAIGFVLTTRSKKTKWNLLIYNYIKN